MLSTQEHDMEGLGQQDLILALQKITKNLDGFTLRSADPIAKFALADQRLDINRIDAEGTYLIKAMWWDASTGWNDIAKKLTNQLKKGKLKTMDSRHGKYSKLNLNPLKAGAKPITWTPEFMHPLKTVKAIIPKGSANISAIRNDCIRQFCENSRSGAVGLEVEYNVTILGDDDHSPTSPDLPMLSLCQMNLDSPPVNYRRIWNTVTSVGEIMSIKKTGALESIESGLSGTTFYYIERFVSALSPSDVGVSSDRKEYLRKLFSSFAPGLRFTWTWDPKFHNFTVESTNTILLAKAAIGFMANVKPVFPGVTKTVVNGSVFAELGVLRPDVIAADEWDFSKSPAMKVLLRNFGYNMNLLYGGRSARPQKRSKSSSKKSRSKSRSKRNKLVRRKSHSRA